MAPMLDEMAGESMQPDDAGRSMPGWGGGGQGQEQLIKHIADLLGICFTL